MNENIREYINKYINDGQDWNIFFIINDKKYVLEKNGNKTYEYEKVIQLLQKIKIIDYVSFASGLQQTITITIKKYNIL